MEVPLIVEGLSKSYKGVTAVHDLDIRVEKGEVFSLLGHNGAGKTTTIECILDVRKPDTGKIRLLGMDPAEERKQVFERVGVQFQQTGYHSKIRVSEICEVTAALYEKPADWRDLLKLFGLAGMEKRIVAELSGGERQKLSVLLALIPDPDFVFLDELTTGLDSKARRDVWKILTELKRRGLTIFLTSHYMDEVQALCDRICILKQGEITALDTVQSIIDQSPCSTLEEAYLWHTGEELEEVESL